MAMTAPEQSVTSMREYLELVLADAEALEAYVHDAVGRIRERVHAARLAEDPEFLARLTDLRERIDSGESLGPGVDLDELRRRYQPTR